MSSFNHTADATATLKRYILDELGFDAVGVARAARFEGEGVRLEGWLARGYQGSMGWLARNVEKRIDVGELMPGARSVIVVARNYPCPACT